MGKRVKALLVALALLVTTVLPAGATLTNPVTAHADENSLSIVFHFTGTDLTATGAEGVGYQLYTWSEGGGEGAAYDMVLSDDGTEMTYKHVLPSTATLRQGFIVRLGNDWSKKDWEADRFVDLSSITGGTVNVYIESKVGEFTQDNSDAIEGLKITSASNPSSGEFQDRIIDGKPLYEHVGEKVREWGDEFMGDEYSYVGAVVGATYPEMGEKLRKIMPRTLILVPGYGAQGGKGSDLKPFFNEDKLGAIVNSSR